MSSEGKKRMQKNARYVWVGGTLHIKSKNTGNDYGKEGTS